MALGLAAIVFVGGIGLGVFVYLPMRRELQSLGRQFGIDRWVAWGLFALSIAGIALVTAVSGSLPENDFLTLGVIVLYMVGWFGLAYAVSNYRLHRVLQALGRTETGAVSSEAGRVAVSGVATAVDRSGTTPFLGQDALCYSWAIDVHRYLPYAGWYTTAIGQGGVPFRVDDGSGPVLIVPDEAEFRIASTIRTRQVDADESPPATALDSLVDQDVGDAVTETTHRYEERFVPEDETVYVLGTSRSPDAGLAAGDSPVIDGGDPFVIGTGHVDTVRRRLGRTVRVAGLGGTLAVLSGYLGQLLASGVTPV